MKLKTNRIITTKPWRVKNKTGHLLFGKLTKKIIGFCYEIHKQYGSGQKESVYQKALKEKLEINKIPYKKELSISIKSEDTGKSLGSHRLDFVIDKKVVVETKAIKFTPTKLEQQLYSYLKNSEYKVGLMINFGSSKLYIRRIILTK
ncbi:GxxExxY protein [Candidatus Woesebacteria bacterium]|nr:GxxExxY protein [Candidatus Woesebacteria bacterium]